jgi:ribosomal protein S12 methylthiotransferase accessory factor YcaO
MNPLRPGGKEHNAAVYKAAMEKLYGFGLITGPEMRHQASLAPCAMQRQWKMDLRVSDGPVEYRLQGTMTSYGRGLSWDEARVSLAMEMIERVSSFAGVRDGKISSPAEPCGLIRAAYSQLRAQKIPALDPSLLSSEVLYADQELNWMPAWDKDGLEILVPFQIVFLFANLDEPDLFGGLGSTGLASGMTMEGARLRGLLEVLERDSATVTPYDPKRCFTIVTDEPEPAALLEDYAARDIHVVFQDMTTEFGVPCYTAFVTAEDGTVVKGTAAGLSARKALVSAMTETPWPYPHGPASKEAVPELPVVQLESLPDYELGDAALELKMLEDVLTGWGYKPLYADLTRADLRLPVARAIVPGLEIACDFDRYSRISPRTAARGLELMERG